MDEVERRRELGAFLRSRRESTDPRDVGLTTATRRRTPGLRREELSLLAGVSLTWYTWLEQGRDISVSRSVIDSLARVLRLSSDDCVYLYSLAGMWVPGDSPHRDEVDPVLAQLIESLMPNPASIIDHWWDIYAWNAAFDWLLGGIGTLPVNERNMMRLAFGRVQDDRLLHTGWSDVVGDLVGQLRTHRARHPHDPRGTQLVEEMLATSAKFAEMWQSYAIRQFRSSEVVMEHPTGGLLTFNFTKLAIADDESQQLVVYLPRDPSTASALRGIDRDHARDCLETGRQQQ
jgi:hypothetical protein